MCGINGIYSNSGVNKLRERAEKMNCSILHRGPDAGLVTLEADILALGHRRLSIIDTNERSNQPMSSNSGTWCIVFNGEIYNFEEIKLLLDYDFRTNSDTEVIVASIEQRGIDWFLSKANGMFAIGAYNNKSKELYVIRDRFGIKPLYYTIVDNIFIFSSEIKGLLASGLVEAKFNECAIDEYLANRYVRAPYTFFENISQVMPGSFVKVNEDIQITTKAYWELPSSFNMSKDYDEEKILQEFDGQVSQAVKYRLIADVPLGTYLSGGIDSSLITAITAKNSTEKLNTYTIGFPELNEFKYSRIISKLYNTAHHEIVMEKAEYLGKWEELISFKDSPLGVPNEIPLALMSSELKKKITVVLSGEGADELLGGYGKIFRSPFDHKNHHDSIPFYDYLISEYEYVPREIRDEVLKSPIDYRSQFDSKIKEEFSGKTNEENVFRFFHNYHVKSLLQRVDMTTMQTSVEARVPFLDHELVEYTYESIPYDLKLRWNSDEAYSKAKLSHSKQYSELLDTPKYLLRKLAYKFIPESIVDRKKMGFPVPLNDWFGDISELGSEYLSDAPWIKEGGLDLLNESIKSEGRYSQILWMFINVEIFRKKYFEKEWRW